MAGFCFIIQQMDIAEIVNDVKKLVVDYIEGVISTADFRNMISVFDKTDIYEKLTSAGESEIISIIDLGSDILFLSTHEYYDPNDSHSVQKVIERYYKKIKSK